MVAFVGCNGQPDCGHPGHSARLHHPARPRGGALTVDMHCHAQSFRADALVKPHMPPPDPLLRFNDPLTAGVNAEHFGRITEPMSVAARRLADMDAMGIDVQVISPSPGHYNYALAPDIGLAAARMVNDDMAALAATDSRRFVALGTVPLQHTALAIEEMRRCVRELGMRGIEINTNVNGAELADPSRAAFFAAAEELDVLLYLHPMTFWLGPRFGPHYLNNTVGHPLDTTLALSHLIFEGVLERHAGLKICVAHGGGYLPMYSGRLDHAWHARPDARGRIPRPPSEYLRRLFFDTVVYDPANVAELVRRFGSEHIVLGTDYPFDMAETDPLGLLAQVAGLDDAALARIAGGNAAALLGLSPLLPTANKNKELI